MINAIKYAMNNGGNPLVITQENKEEIAENLMKELSAKSCVCLTPDQTLSVLHSADEFEVAIIDGDSSYKDYYDNLFAKLPSIRRICLAKTEIRDDTNSVFDTIIFNDGPNRYVPIENPLWDDEK